MKTQSMIALTLALIGSALIASNVHAGESKPCKEIRSACESAGFTKGGYKPKKNEFKGLYHDCIQKIVADETVPGVNVTPDQVSACKEKKEKRAEKRAAKKAGASTPAASTSAPAAAPSPTK